jgi:hypothetical protein
MKSESILIAPSFGIAGEKEFSITIDFKSAGNRFTEKKDSFTFFLKNKNAIKIPVNLLKMEPISGTSDEIFNINIKFYLSFDIPRMKSQKTEDRSFILYLLNNEQIIYILNDAFKVYDSIAILVHGVLASPQVWDNFISCNNSNIKYLIFDYEKENFKPALHLIGQFNNFINNELDEKGYFGRFDIVCHSMGAQITRLWMLNYPVNDNANAHRVRQWIGVAPVNHGSANADGFIITGISVLFNRPAYLELKTDSFTTKILEMNEINELNSSVNYRVILGYNSQKKRFFYCWHEKKIIPLFIQKLLNKKGISSKIPIPLSFNGLTKAYNATKKAHYKTFFGDGIVANCLSLLPNASVDIFEGLNHRTILMDQEVCDLLRYYLMNNPQPTRNESVIKQIEDNCKE